MGIEWTGDTLHVVAKRLADRTLKDAQNFFYAAFEELSAEGVAYMQDIISNTPSSISPGKPDRIDTGVMIASVQLSGSVVAGDGEVLSEFGWLSMVEPYFAVQEHGGYAPDLKAGPKVISPMHALTGAYLNAKAGLEEKVRAWV